MARDHPTNQKCVGATNGGGEEEQVTRQMAGGQ